MCGIAGIVNLDGKPVNSRILEKMIILQRHRGPDDEGLWIEGNIGLANCRLSILDLSSAGHQPMGNHDGHLMIVHNGEIYNYVELRRDLEKRGHVFKTDTDTEVILHSFEVYGQNCLEMFNGMWAFAIWDRKRKELFCSRDRLGVKPFYYYLDKNMFVFASEMKALLECLVIREPNEALIYDFLKFGMLDHTEETFFKKIRKLPPATWLRIKLNDVVTGKYWDFEVSDEIESQNSDREDAQKLRELFINAVELRLRSDVPVGSCLSGGLDSSSVVCVVNNLLRKKHIESIGTFQKTFSSCFDDRKFDEREYIEEVIRNTNAERNYVFPKPEEFLKNLDDLVYSQEEPFSGASMFAQWKVIKEAKKKVKVLLDGQGGDELLGGYRKFYFFYLVKLFKSGEWLEFFKTAAPFLTSLETLGTLNLNKGLKYLEAGSRLSEIDTFLNSIFLKTHAQREINFRYQGNLGHRFKEDLTKWSLPVLLRYEDKNSGAFGMEARLPFLDYRVIEQIAQMPLRQKIRNGWTKFVFREAMKGILPEKIRLRKSKLGFVTPEDIWYKTNLSKDIESVLRNSQFITNYIHGENLLNAFEKYQKSHTFFLNGNIFFRFYILELWGRKFIMGH